MFAHKRSIHLFSHVNTVYLAVNLRRCNLISYLLCLFLVRFSFTTHSKLFLYCIIKPLCCAIFCFYITKVNYRLIFYLNFTFHCVLFKF